jgi:hypothetical protein
VDGKATRSRAGGLGSARAARVKGTLARSVRPGARPRREDYPQFFGRITDLSTLSCVGRTNGLPRRYTRAMRVELLYWDGDPHYMTARQRLVEVLTEDAFETPIQMVAVNSQEDAELLEFIGSPTIRMDGDDIQPDSSAAVGLRLRTYPADDDLDGPRTEPIPGKRLIRRAVERARGWGHGRHQDDG